MRRSRSPVLHKLSMMAAASVVLALSVSPAGGAAGDCWSFSFGSSKDGSGAGVRDGFSGIDPRYVNRFADEDLKGYLAGGVLHGEDSITGFGDAWAVRLRDDGTVDWTKAWGGPGNEFIEVVKNTRDEGFIIGGARASSRSDPTRYAPWLLKLSKEGTVEWERVYDGYPVLGRILSVKETIVLGSQTLDNPDGVVDGYIAGGFGFGEQHDGFVIRTGLRGERIWNNYFRTELRMGSFTTGDTYDEVWDVRQTTDGGFVGIGRTNRPIESDAFAFKLAPTGHLEWIFTYSRPWVEEARWVEETFDLGFIVGGRTSDNKQKDAWLMKLSPSGVPEWQYVYHLNGDEEAFHVHSLHQGREGYVVGGYTRGTHGDDGWIFEVDLAGIPVWGWAYGGPSDDVIKVVHPSHSRANADHLIATGYTRSFGAGSTDGWVMKLPADGRFQMPQAPGFHMTAATPRALPTVTEVLTRTVMGFDGLNVVTNPPPLASVAVDWQSQQQAACP